MKALTAEEQAQLDTMSAPDEESNVYDWGEEFQRRILGMLIRDKNFLIEAQGLVLPSYFENDAHKLICRLLFKYFESYKSIPNQISLEQELDEKIKDRDAKVKVYYRGELSAVYNFYVPGLEERDYLRDKLVDFAKDQAIKHAFFESLAILKKQEVEDKWVKVYGLLETAMKVDRNFDIGQDYFHDYEARYKRVQEAKERGDIFTSGFESIDNALDGGMCRGEIGSWIGTSGSGKSICLVTAAVANLKQHKKVLYITLEINEDKTAERFDFQLADPSNQWGVGVGNLYQHEDKVFDALSEFVADYEDERVLMIKQFPGGDMSVHEFKSYMNRIRLEGFSPDLVIIDYIGEMKDYTGMPTWESRQKIVRNLRGEAIRDNVCMLVAMQPDRKAKEAIRQGELIDDDNLADSYGQVRPLDCLWSLNRTADEIHGYLGRVKICKHRSGKSGTVFYIEQDQRTLQIREITKDNYTERKKKVDLAKEINRDEDAATQAVRESQKRHAARQKKLDQLIATNKKLLDLKMEELGEKHKSEFDELRKRFIEGFELIEATSVKPKQLELLNKLTEAFSQIVCTLADNEVGGMIKLRAMVEHLYAKCVKEPEEEMPDQMYGADIEENGAESDEIAMPDGDAWDQAKES